jgi:hypothetical protein
MTNHEHDHDPFAERVAQPLREEVHADPTFEARVMSAVHLVDQSEGAPIDSTPRSWWLRPRTWRLTPLGALALAAGIVGVMVAGSLTFGSITAGRSGGTLAVARVDTVHLVRFVFVDSTASRVSLVGTFNQWQKDAIVLTPVGGGAWTVDVSLPTGRHEYAFVVSGRRGQRWVADPLSPMTRDDYDTPSSVIAVRSPGA